ncbi:MAG: penicillin-binding protein 1A [Gammaproteobacteria bacterium]|nr:penicillin-binding protein 1A [Gammaproteobacteria bacterium]MCW8988175.1 penicillin-binding protein 1A [Gammaproteobacteria bacterium]
MKLFFKKSIKIFGILTLAGGIIASIFIGGAYLYLSPRLPSIDTLKDVQLQVPLRVYAKSGELIAEFGEMKRVPLKYEEFPQHLINAVLAAEDDRFFEHPGVDYQGILRAVVHLLRTGKKGQGGSTITMQVARNFFLSREKTYLRKLNEIFLAFKIEGFLSKEEILSLYLNKIYLGKRAYGFSAATQVYYGKEINQLSVAEYAMIAGLPKAPSSYNPINNPERALIRRNYVLGRMRILDFIDEEVYQAALAAPDLAKIHGQDIELEAPYIAEMVRNEVVSRYGAEAYTGGYSVYTTLNADRQRAANKALRNALLDYDRRHGYRGHLGFFDLNTDEQATQKDKPVTELAQTELTELDENSDEIMPQVQELDEFAIWRKELNKLPTFGDLIPSLVFQVNEKEAYAYTAENKVVYLPWEHIEWARTYVDDNTVEAELTSVHERLKEGDIIYTVPSAQPGCSWLAQKPTVGGALVSLAPEDGAVEALNGGYDYYESKFNRAIQAQRQPGSSFKPFIYTAALDKGYTAASIIADAPVVFDAPGLEDTWRPENYSGKFYGDTRLRLALIKSRNLVSIRLLRDIGIGYAIRYIKRFGFTSKMLPRDLSLALGSGSLTPYDLANGYAVFANGGYRVKPYFIDYIVGAKDKIVYMEQPERVCRACRKEELIEKKEEEKQKEGESQVTDVKEHVAEPLPALPPDLSESFLSLMDEDERLQVNQGPLPLKLAEQILSPQTSFLINTMMRDVILSGTGRRALAIGRKDLAGKTGTTNDQRDAWFTGFNADLVTIAWVGFDNPRPLGERETGAQAALPMWVDYMRDALVGVEEKQLEQPPGLVSVRIDPKTGKLANSTTQDAIFEFFLADQVPTEQADVIDVEQTGTSTVTPPADITEDIF